MQFLLVGFVVLSGGVLGNKNDESQNPGISQFWADDYKIFEQIYGRTSDRQLYGVTLPPTVGYGIDATNLLKTISQATEKKEQLNLGDYDSSPTATQLDLQKYANKYALLQKYTKFPQTEKEIKNPKAAYKFVGYNQFRPISKENDPETYDYFKHLEMLSKQQNIGFPQRTAGLGAYKTYANIPEAVNPENTDAYKSIQDILDAHEAKKRKRPEEDVKYISYPGARKNVRYISSNDLGKYTKCSSGRCRKRTIPVRIRSRPVIRKIKVISE